MIPHVNSPKMPTLFPGLELEYSIGLSYDKVGFDQEKLPGFTIDHFSNWVDFPKNVNFIP